MGIFIKSRDEGVKSLEEMIEEVEEEEEIHQAPPPDKFRGKVTIKIRFKTIDEYRNFRMYIMKTGWYPGPNYPSWEEMELVFEKIEDISKITAVIVNLLQNGFEVYTCHYQLEKDLAEKEHPEEEDFEEPPEVSDIFEDPEFNKRIREAITTLF